MGGLDDYAQALGAAQQLVPNLRDIRTQELQQRALAEQPGLIRAQTERAQIESQQAVAEQQRRTTFAADLARLGEKPTSDRLYQLGARYPEFAQTINQAAKGLGEEDRVGVVRRLAPVQSYIANGKPEKALDLVRRGIAADRAAGIEPDEDDLHLEEQLASGDPNQVKAAGGTVFALLAALNPDTAASNLNKRDENAGGQFTLVPGAKRFGPDGELIASAEFAPRPITVRDGETVVEYQPGGGGQTSSGGSSGRYTGGWTPRARNGGDNDDAAVDGKIAGAARFLGVEPGADISSMSPMQIARAMTLSEGGRGSLADRNNNPGNIRGAGGEGGFKRFPTKEAGLAAAAALVARKLKSGQTTVRSLIEGLPVGGGAQAAGGPRVIAQGAPKAGYQVLSPEENAAAGLDPNVRYQRSPDGQITALGGQSKAQLKPIPTAVGKEIIANRGTLRQIDTALSELGKYPGAVGPGTGMAGDTFTNWNDPKGVAARAAIGKIGGQIIHDVSGAAVTLSEEPRFRPYVPLVTDTPSVAAQKLRQLRALAQGVLTDYYDQYSEGQGYRPFASSARAAKPASPPPTAGFKILRVRPK